MSKAEQTRQMIIEKAAPIFNKKGYLGTSISDLTESTGLTKGAIYGNFKNKNEIALAAFEYNIQKILTYVRSELDKADNSIEKLLVLPKYYFNNFAEFTKQGGCPITNTAIDSDDTNSVLNKKVKEIIEGLKKGIIDIVNEGISKKEIVASADPVMIASTIISLIQGGNLLSKACGDINYTTNSLRQVELIVSSIKKK
jgi:TetR/AcrR family transcriptional regulator, transcriptional repressor for nem operon